MCDTCFKNPTAIPPIENDGMTPAIVVIDSVDAAIIMNALHIFGDGYIKRAEQITNDSRTTDAATAVHLRNMINVTERITNMMLILDKAHEHDSVTLI